MGGSDWGLGEFGWWRGRGVGACKDGRHSSLNSGADRGLDVPEILGAGERHNLCNFPVSFLFTTLSHKRGRPLPFVLTIAVRECDDSIRKQLRDAHNALMHEGYVGQPKAAHPEMASQCLPS